MNDEAIDQKNYLLSNMVLTGYLSICCETALYILNSSTIDGIDFTQGNSLLDLGCGEFPLEIVYETATKKTRFRKIYAVDISMKETTTKYQPIDIPIQVLKYNEITPDIPKYLPAISSHPGFSLTNKESSTIYGFENTWEETLTKLHPPIIVFSSYTEKEQINDLLFLNRLGYDFWEDCSLSKFREDFSTDSLSGFGWSISSVISKQVIVNLENVEKIHSNIKNQKL